LIWKAEISRMNHMRHTYGKADGDVNVRIGIRDVYWLSLGVADLLKVFVHFCGDWISVRSMRDVMKSVFRPHT